MSRALLLSAALLLVAADPPGVDLKGLVTDPDGKPLPGAHVFISTARVRRGTSPLCPSCYPDCIKTAQTDSTGKFVIPKLDPELIFRVLVVSETHKAQVVENVDPAAKALETFLVPLPPTIDPRKTIRGRVLGSKGEPIVGATIEPYGAKLKDRRWWGTVREVDPLTVTNLRGEFLITSTEPDIALDVRVDAREHAKRIVPLLSAGESHDIALETGGWIRGRVLKDGRPVPGLALGLVQADRSAGNFLGHTEIGTNQEGEFEFPNVPQNEDYYFYSLMSGSEKLGALAVYEVHLGTNRKVVDVGNLPMEPAFRLAGRVLLSDGGPIPEGTRLMLSRQRAWDHQSATLDSDGLFSFEAIPEEAIELIIRIDGYRLAPTRNRFQLTRDGCLALFMDKDRPAVEIHLEPAPVKAK